MVASPNIKRKCASCLDHGPYPVHRPIRALQTDTRHCTSSLGDQCLVLRPLNARLYTDRAVCSVPRTCTKFRTPIGSAYALEPDIVLRTSTKWCFSIDIMHATCNTNQAAIFVRDQVRCFVLSSSAGCSTILTT